MTEKENERRLNEWRTKENLPLIKSSTIASAGAVPVAAPVTSSATPGLVSILKTSSSVPRASAPASVAMGAPAAGTNGGILASPAATVDADVMNAIGGEVDAGEENEDDEDEEDEEEEEEEEEEMEDDVGDLDTDGEMPIDVDMILDGVDLDLHI